MTISIRELNERRDADKSKDNYSTNSSAEDFKSPYKCYTFIGNYDITYNYYFYSSIKAKSI